VVGQEGEEGEKGKGPVQKKKKEKEREGLAALSLRHQPKGGKRKRGSVLGGKKRKGGRKRVSRLTSSFFMFPGAEGNWKGRGGEGGRSIPINYPPPCGTKKRRRRDVKRKKKRGEKQTVRCPRPDIPGRGGGPRRKEKKGRNCLSSPPYFGGEKKKKKSVQSSSSPFLPVPRQLGRGRRPQRGRKKEKRGRIILLLGLSAQVRRGRDSREKEKREKEKISAVTFYCEGGGERKHVRTMPLSIHGSRSARPERNRGRKKVPKKGEKKTTA